MQGSRIYQMETDAFRNFKSDQNTDAGSHAAFLWDLLGTTWKGVLDSHKWIETVKDKEDTIFDRLVQTCQPAGNQILYKNQFSLLSKVSLRL